MSTLGRYIYCTLRWQCDINCSIVCLFLSLVLHYYSLISTIILLFTKMGEKNPIKNEVYNNVQIYSKCDRHSSFISQCGLYGNRNYDSIQFHFTTKSCSLHKLMITRCNRCSMNYKIWRKLLHVSFFLFCLYIWWL